MMSLLKMEEVFNCVKVEREKEINIFGKRLNDKKSNKKENVMSFGKFKAGKTFNENPTLCKTNCGFKCSENLGILQRKSIFDHYHRLDANGKRNFIFGFIKPEPIKQKTLSDNP